MGNKDVIPCGRIFWLLWLVALSPNYNPPHGFSSFSIIAVSFEYSQSFDCLLYFCLNIDIKPFFHLVFERINVPSPGWLTTGSMVDCSRLREEIFIPWRAYGRVRALQEVLYGDGQ